jgi:phosphate transport system substrate-binding protein
MHKILAVTLAAVLAPGVAAAQVVYGGSSTFADTVLNGGASQGFSKKKGIEIRVADVSGTGKGLKSLAEGTLNLVGSGRTLTPDEKKAGLLGTVVGYDGLALFVNKANPVKDLGKEQLKSLFMGKVKSWKELGGKDVAIVPLIEPLASKRATVQLIQELVLDRAAFGPGIREMDQLKDQLVEISRSEGAICVASIGFLSSADPAVKRAVHAISLDSIEPSAANIRSGMYLLSRPMLLVAKGVPSGDVKAFLDYMLSKDGQAIVAKYFVAVKR